MSNRLKKAPRHAEITGLSGSNHCGLKQMMPDGWFFCPNVEVQWSRFLTKSSTSASEFFINILPRSQYPCLWSATRSFSLPTRGKRNSRMPSGIAKVFLEGISQTKQKLLQPWKMWCREKVSWVELVFSVDGFCFYWGLFLFGSTRNALRGNFGNFLKVSSDYCLVREIRIMSVDVSVCVSCPPREILRSGTQLVIPDTAEKSESCRIPANLFVFVCL